MLLRQLTAIGVAVKILSGDMWGVAVQIEAVWETSWVD